MKQALDLYCGAGGASMGIHLAGYDVTGVDIAPMPRYPFDFIQADAIQYLADNLDKIKSTFDFIWASPPCQAYSQSTVQFRIQGKEYPDLVEATRDLLNQTGLPYIIENVVGSPLKNPVTLCGTMFPELKVFRHRLFESNRPLQVEMKCDHAGHKNMRHRGDGGDFISVVGKDVGTTQERRDAMGIDWMNYKEITQAIPPDFSWYLVKQI